MKAAVALSLCGIASACVRAQTVATGFAKLEKRPVLRHDMESFPRVVPNAAVTPAVAAKINASLERWDQQVLANAKFCRMERAGEPEADDWSRGVEVTMRGPHYLSLLAQDDYSCGAPHSLDASVALVYDLTTGSPVNWTRLLPPEAKGELLHKKGQLPIGLVRWPLLLKKEQKAANGDCKEVFSSDRAPSAYVVWLDGKAGALEFGPTGMIHFDSELCGEPVAIGVDEARKLGVAAELVDALEAARKGK